MHTDPQPEEEYAGKEEEEVRQTSSLFPSYHITAPRYRTYSRLLFICSSPQYKLHVGSVSVSLVFRTVSNHIKQMFTKHLLKE